MLSLKGEVLICDLGSTDKTVHICQKMGIWPQRSSATNFDQIRNNIIQKAKNDWQFFLEPWETLRFGHKNILKCTSGPPGSFNFTVIQGGNVSKETRLWDRKLNLKFVNPVYETIIDKTAVHTDGIILSKVIKDQYDKLKLISEWKESRPTANEPHYYMALTHLSQKNYPEFERVAEYYLFRERTALINMAMIKYYYALVKCHYRKDYKTSLEKILSCLSANCLMAEFWCLLGDIHYSLLREYKKAFKFYENAILLGQHRLKDDEWPMDIDKYKEYPEKMMDSCLKLLDNQLTIGEDNQ